MTVLADDATMTQILRDLIADDATVSTLGEPWSLSSLADTLPDAVLIGPGAAGDHGAWELLATIRQDFLLGAVPIILCTLDVGAHSCANSRCADVLAEYGDVRVVQMPCDGEQVREFVRELQSGPTYKRHDLAEKLFSAY